MCHECCYSDTDGTSTPSCARKAAQITLIRARERQ
jgi:hypothetical protein